MGEAAELHALRCFLVQVRGFFRVIGIDGDVHAAARHQGGVVRNRVVGLDLVGPPIGKRGGADACGGQFIGDFVTFEDMLESTDFETKLVGDSKKHQDFILAVAVRMDVAFAFEHFHERIEAQVAARGDEVFFSGRNAFVVFIPHFLVVARFGERSANCLFHAHARSGIPLGLAGHTEVRTLGIFTQSELDSRQCAFERQSRGRLAPAELDHDGLPADGIGVAMEETETLPSLTLPSMAMCEWQSMIPGMTNCPAASMTWASLGALMDWPTSAILPSLIRMAPCSMVPCETVRTVAF